MSRDILSAPVRLQASGILMGISAERSRWGRHNASGRSPAVWVEVGSRKCLIEYSSSAWKSSLCP